MWGALLGGAKALFGGGVGRKVGGWVAGRIGGSAARAAAMGGTIVRAAGTPVGGAVIAGGAAMGGTAIARRRGQTQDANAVREAIRAAYVESGNDPDAYNHPAQIEPWVRDIVAGTKTINDLRSALGLSPIAGRAGGMGGGGGLNILVDPEVVPTASWDPRGEKYVCPPGWVLVEAGDGPVCMLREVAYALGFRRRPRRGGGITGREVAAARKVQRFGLGLFVNKQPKVRLKKGGRK